MSQVHEFGNTAAFLGNSGSFVVFHDNTGFLDDTKDQKVTVTPKNTFKKEVDFVYWGQNNKLPVEVIDKVHRNVTVASNAGFNANICYGDGVMVVKKIKKDGKITYEEQLESEQPEIFEFLENNNVIRLFQDCGHDLAVFYDGFVELIMNKEKEPKIVKIRQKEATFSRLSVQNEKTGKIEYHGYSAKWGEGMPDDVIVTPFLDREAPLYDLKIRLGKLPHEKTGKCQKVSDGRFVLSIGLPTPGRFYYNKPYWWTIFISIWYDISCAIPHLKKALMENEMILKYEISINETYWGKLFQEEGIQGDKKKQAVRKTEFLRQMDEFLANKKNAGKSFVKHFKYDQVKGYEIHDIIIKPIESFLKGGEYIEDSEEASNMICYAMGVHPSLQGASPGKNKTINGTEARELFIIKQALTKPLRQALLLPMYIVKAINGWDPDIHFVIPNIMLTTLDQNTGQEKSIGNQKI